MSELTSIRKILVGAGTEQYLPFGLSKLRQMAAESPDGYASRVWRTSNGMTVMVEFCPPSSGTVTVIGTGFMCLGRIGLDGEGNPQYRLVGASSLKKDFKELNTFSIDYDWILKDFKDSLYVYPGGHNQAYFSFLSFPEINSGYIFRLFIVKPNGEIENSMNLFVDTLNVGLDSMVSWIDRVGQVDPKVERQDRYIFLGTDTELIYASTPHEHHKIYLYARSSDDGCKTWSGRYRALPERAGLDEHQQFHTLANLGNGVLLVVVSITARNDSGVQKTTPYFMRSENGGLNWRLTEATPLSGGYTTVNSKIMLAALGHDKVLLTYAHIDRLGTDNYAYTCLSEDNGLTWNSPVRREWTSSACLNALGPGGAFMLARFGDDDEGIWKLVLTGDYGESWTVRTFPVVGNNPWPYPSLVTRPPVRDETHTVDIDKAVLVVPVYAEDGYYAYVTTDGAQNWTQLGQIIALPKQQEIDFGLANFYYVAVLSEAGDIAFPRIYFNDGEPLS